MSDVPADSFALDYLDQAVLRISFGAAPEQTADEVWEYQLSEPPEGWTERTLVAAFEELLLNAPGGPYEYGLRTTRAVYSWGADSAVLVIAAYVTVRALDAVLAMGVEGGVKGLMRRLAQHETPAQQTPMRDAMLATAQWRVAEAFVADYDALQLVAEERRTTSGVWEFTFEDDRNRYTVEMGAVDGIPLSSRVRREALRPE